MPTSVSQPCDVEQGRSESLTASAASSEPYRRDIDGLRALAVGAVILFHVFPRALPGGFIGVDVFFVISGYLITSIIDRDARERTFSLKRFYLRRIKRLMPALTVVAVTTLVFASWLLEPVEYMYFTTSAAAAWAFLSNVFFSMLSGGYFSVRSESFPFLHTWSLSVEEQFYLLYPVLATLALRYLREHFDALLIVGIGGLLLVSQLGVGSPSAYFLLTSRAHELLVGALTFSLVQRRADRLEPFRGVLGVAGLAVLACGMFGLSSASPFPGLNTLYPCIGTALLLASGVRGGFVARLLEGRCLVFIGLMSYSLYLWHWPILALLRYRGLAITVPVGLGAIVAACACAALTYRFVENPLRHSSLSFRQAFIFLYAAPAAAFALVAGISYRTAGLPQRFSPDVRALLSSYSMEVDLTRQCTLRSEDVAVGVAGLNEHCAFGAANATAESSLLLFGDSHANHLKPFLGVLAEDAGVRAVYSAQGSCDPLEGLDAPSASTCAQRNKALFSAAGNYHFVALAGQWSYAHDLPQFERRLRLAIEQIRAAGGVPIVFKDTPSYSEDLSRCVLSVSRGWSRDASDCTFPSAYVAAEQGGMDAVVDAVAATYPDVLVIDPKKLICDTQRCRTYEGNAAYFRDSNHLNAQASRLLATKYLALAGNPLRSTASAH